MFVLVPDYYPQFHCIADQCQHSCCIGWEIDVDEDSLSRFQQVEGPLGEKLRRCIQIEDDGTAHFILEGDAERCPFLTEKNLCELILAYGESSLCDICTDHPRFRNYFSNHVEMGLGLCCEEAARIVLTQQTPFRLIPLESVAAPEENTSEESQFFTSRDMLFQILANTRAHWTLRVNQICEAVEVPLPTIDPAKIGAFLLTLERLDPSWDDELARLIQLGDSTHQNLSDQAMQEAIDPLSPQDSQGHDILFDFRQSMQEQGRSEEYIRLLEYFLFRHLINTPDEMRSRVLLCVLAVSIIEWMGAAHYHESSSFSLADQINLVRMFSSEIEYSDENVALILEEIDRTYL